jgi:hypothetical protein
MMDMEIEEVYLEMEVKDVFKMANKMNYKELLISKIRGCAVNCLELNHTTLPKVLSMRLKNLIK